jgi:predicted transcriptional regulator
MKSTASSRANQMLVPLSYSIKQKKSNKVESKKAETRLEGEGKFGPRVNYTKIPNSIFENPLLSCQEKMVLCILRYHARDKNNCWPSIKTICYEAGICKPNLQKILKGLEKQKYIKRHSRHGHASLYELSSLGN